MIAKDIKVGQVFIEDIGIFLLVFTNHDSDYCYVTYKKLWLWHVNQNVIDCQSSGGTPWESTWTHELVV